MDTIREPTLRELIETNSISLITAIGQKGGFAVAFRCGGAAERFLSSARGELRLFSNLTTLAGYLGRLGISRFEVNTANYEAGRLRPARPDRAEALRRTRTKPKQGQIFGGDA